MMNYDNIPNMEEMEDELEDEMIEFEKREKRLAELGRRKKLNLPPVDPKPLKLINQQIIHVKEIDDIIGEKDKTGICACVINSSETGLGKTYAFMAVSLERDLPIFNVAPASVLSATKRKVDGTIGVNFYQDEGIMANISYNSLIVKNHWLIPPDKDDKNGVFLLKKPMKAAIKSGIQFVVDEFHKVKNEGTSSFLAVSSIVKYIMKKYKKYLSDVENYETDLQKWSDRSDNDDSYSEPEMPKFFSTRVHFASATHMDKAKQAQTFLRVLGLIDDNIGVSDYQGFSDFLSTALDIESAFSSNGEDGILPDRLRSIQNYYRNYYGDKRNPFTLYTESGKVANRKTIQATMRGITNDSLNQIIYTITTLSIFNRISSEIEPYLPRICFNGFFDFDNEKSRTLYLNGLNVLSRALSGGSLGNILADISIAIEYMQMGAVGSAVNYLHRMYKADSTSKCILAAKHIKVLVRAKKILMALKVPESEIVFFVGQSKPEFGDREKNLEAFMQHNLKVRFFLMTTSIGAGFDANDTNPNGNRRYMITLEDYSVIDQHQSLGRIFRLGMYTYGIGIIWHSFLYGAAFNAIRQAIKQKSLILGDVTSDQDDVSYKRLFPGNYPRYIDCAYDDESVEGLYINEEKYMKNGTPISDYDLIVSVSKSRSMHVYDPPLAYIKREDDDCPVNVIADSESKGTKGIYRNNPHLNDTYLVSDEAAQTDVIIDTFKQINEKIQLANIYKEIQRIESGRAQLAPLYQEIKKK